MPAWSIPIQWASDVSNIWTKTSPTSFRAHSSNTSTRNRPYWVPETDLVLARSLSSCSTIGMSCMNVAPSSSRRNV